MRQTIIMFNRTQRRMSEAQMAHLRKWQMTAKYKRIPTPGIRYASARI